MLANHEDRRPRKGDKLEVYGKVFIDHGHFLEIHPEDQPVKIVAHQ